MKNKSGKKSNTIVFIFVLVLLIAILIPVLSSSFKGKNSVSSASELKVIKASVEFEQEALNVNLIKGEIITNRKVSNVYLNINGYGVYNLNFSRKASIEGFCITLSEDKDILNMAFDVDKTLNVDVYVEYSGRSFFVLTEKVNVVSCWIHS